MSKRIGKKRTASDVEDEENCVAVIQALKENNNILRDENVKYRIENKELKDKIRQSVKIIKGLRYFLYTVIAVDVIALVGVVVDYYEFNKFNKFIRK